MPRLFEIPIEQRTKPGELVYEACCGSRSLIIADEKLGRRCRAIDVQPAFVGGTIARFENANGETAVLEGDSFAVIAQERGVAWS